MFGRRDAVYDNLPYSISEL